jgi:PAS domain S-box-containing protein
MAAAPTRESQREGAVARVWERIVGPSATLDDLAARKKARLLAGMMALLITIFVVVDTIFMIARPGYVPPWFGYLFLFTAYALARTRYHAVGAAVLLAMFPIVVFVMTVSADVMEPTVTVGFLVVGLLLGTIFLEIRGLIIQTAIHVAVLVAISIVMPNVELSETEFTATVALNALIGGLAVLHVHHRNHIERARQAALREAEELQSLALAAAAMGTWDWRIDADHVAISERLAQILGCSREQFGGNFEALLAKVHVDDRARVRAHLDEALGWQIPDAELNLSSRPGHRADFQHRVIRPDGSVAIVEVHARVTRDDAGRALRVTSAVVDVTARRKLEERLQTSARVEALGRLAGGIAHDFNNLLMVIQANIELTQLRRKRLGRTDEWPEMEEMLEAVNSGASLIKQLLTTSRQAVIEPKLVDLNAAVRTASEMIRRFISKRIDVVLELDPQLWLAKVDPHQIQQALLNLATNARDAMPDGGRLILRTSNQTRVAGDEHPGEWVAISISDTGVGMDEETKRRAFEPFFTTKSLGDGTGLGLAMVYGTVVQSQGFVRLESTLGEGTTIDLMFPRALE